MKNNINKKNKNCQFMLKDFDKYCKIIKKIIIDVFHKINIFIGEINIKINIHHIDTKLKNQIIKNNLYYTY
jgi:hypothetical protein